MWVSWKKHRAAHPQLYILPSSFFLGEQPQGYEFLRVPHCIGISFSLD